MAPRAVAMPNWGLYLDRPPISVPPKAMQDGMNFRIKNGVVSNLNLGWERFYPAGVTLGSRVDFILNFYPRSLPEMLLFFTKTDIFVHDPGTDRPVYLTPTYSEGTAAASGTAVTAGGSADWTDIKQGDFIHFGDAGYRNPEGTWHRITAAGPTTLTLAESAGTVTAGAYTIRRTFIGNVDDIWSATTFMHDEDSGDDLVIATNGVDPIVSWNGSDASVTLHPEMQFTAEFVTVFSNMLIYGNVTSVGVWYPTSIINSDVGKPLAAGATGTGLSEQLRVSDKPAPLVAALPLGQNLVLYSRRQIIVAQFVGDPLLFVFRAAGSDIGPVGGRAIADFGDYHEFFGADAEYAFDGVGVREVNRHWGRDVIRTMDPIRRVFLYSHFDEENGDLIWSVPGTTDPGTGDPASPPVVAWSEHYLETVPQGVERPVSRRSWPFTAAGNYTRNTGLTWEDAEGTWLEYNYSWNDQFLGLAFPLNIVGDANGDIFIVNQSQRGDGQLLEPSFVKTARMPLDDGKMRALLKRVYPFTGQLNAELTVQVWLADFATSDARDGGAYIYDTSHVEGQFFVTPYRRARYIELQFGAPGTRWTLEGWDTEVQSGGRR